MGDFKQLALKQLVYKLLARVEKLEAELNEIKSKLPHDSDRVEV